MGRLTINPSDYLGKPIDEIESEFIKRQIESVDNPSIEMLKHIGKLVEIERCILDEGDVKLDSIFNDSEKTEKYAFAVSQGIDGYPHIDDRYKKSLKKIHIETRHDKTLSKVQSDIVAKNLIEGGLSSELGRHSIRIEQKILGEREFVSGAKGRGGEYSSLLYHSDSVSKTDHKKILRELKPEKFRDDYGVRSYIKSSDEL